MIGAAPPPFQIAPLRRFPPHRANDVGRGGACSGVAFREAHNLAAPAFDHVARVLINPFGQFRLSAHEALIGGDVGEDQATLATIGRGAGQTGDEQEFDHF